MFVFPSLYEGFGLPPLEAMASGCPVVVSDGSCFPEVCGDAAYFVNPYSPEDIAQGLYEVLTDSYLYSNLREKGIEQAKRFQWDATAMQIERVFNQSLQR